MSNAASRLRENDNQTRVRRQSVKRRAVMTAARTVPAPAFLDPGSGSIVVQGLLAGIAAVVAAGSMFWHQFKTRLASPVPRNQSPATDSTQASDDQIPA